MSALDDALTAIDAEANGVMDVRIARPEDWPDLLLAGLFGDPDAARLSAAVVDSLARIKAAPKWAPTLCATCPKPLRGRFAVAVAYPDKDNPSAAIAFGICRRCGTELPELRERAIQALRSIWPQSRPLPSEHYHREGGRA